MHFSVLSPPLLTLFEGSVENDDSKFFRIRFVLIAHMLRYTRGFENSIYMVVMSMGDVKVHLSDVAFAAARAIDES